MRDDVFAQVAEQRGDVFAQTGNAAWRTIPGMCTDADGHQYDYFETNGIRHGWGGGGRISQEQCQRDCAATPQCVGIQYSNGAGRCGLRVEDGAVVTLPEYETPWNGARGVGPPAGGLVHGDWTCGVNPRIEAEYDPSTWRSLTGMCTDSNNQQYDYFETNGIRHGWGGGGHITLEQCAKDCLLTEGCVGIQHSRGAGRCGLRVEDGVVVTRPEYETPWNGARGVGPVAGSFPQGDWVCSVNPRMGADCDDSVNFMSPGPSYSQISLTDACGSGNCAGNPVYGAPNNDESAKAHCASECSAR